MSGNGKKCPSHFSESRVTPSNVFFWPTVQNQNIFNLLSHEMKKSSREPGIRSFWSFFLSPQMLTNNFLTVDFLTNESFSHYLKDFTTVLMHRFMSCSDWRLTLQSHSGSQIMRIFGRFWRRLRLVSKALTRPLVDVSHSTIEDVFFMIVSLHAGRTEFSQCFGAFKLTWGVNLKKWSTL